MKFLYRQKLCYACYGPDHKAEKCENKRTCSECNENHPTGLHKKEEVKETTPVTSCNTIPLVSEVVSMCVILVRLSHKEDPEKEVLVYAVLDNCSKGTFVREDIMQQMAVPIARSASLSVKTMIGVKMDSSSVIAGLTVRGTEEHLKRYPSSGIIELPDCYTRQEIPIDEDEIPTPDRLRPWKHLEPIISKIPE